LKTSFLDRVKAEKRLGSTALARMTIDCFRELASSNDVDDWLVEGLGMELERARPSMVLLKRFSREVVKRYQMLASVGLERRKALLEACSSVEAEYSEKMRMLVDKAAKYLSRYDTVLTLSHSGTVVNVLSRAEGVGKVLVLESRPMYEGRITANRLSKTKQVDLWVDAASGYAVQNCKACVVGADAVFPDGSFSGKVGSLPLALLCSRYGKPFYVVVDLWKIDEKTGYVIEEGGADEVWEESRWVTIRNPYFEMVGPELVSGYLTEKGLLKPHELTTAI
jgi:translation initiation factor 2B subunit (eIF-2B alpha/beta/delta family)